LRISLRSPECLVIFIVFRPGRNEMRRCLTSALSSSLFLCTRAGRKCRFSAKKVLTFPFMMRLTPANKKNRRENHKPPSHNFRFLVRLISEVSARLALKMYIGNNINFNVWLPLTANLIMPVIGFLSWVHSSLGT